MSYHINKKNIKKLLFIFICFTLPLLANEIDEINIYTLKKYKVNYTELKKEKQDKIFQEYKQVQKLADKLNSTVKNDSLYLVNNYINIIDSWSIKFMNNYTPKEDELKAIYSKNNFHTSPEYKLRVLSVKDKKRFQSIFKQLEDRKGKNRRLKLFEYFVNKDSIDETKSKNGDLGWISLEKLHPDVRQNISKLKISDFISREVEDTFQIIYMEDKKEPKKASFEQSKQVLINIAKKDAVNREIQKLVK